MVQSQPRWGTNLLYSATSKTNWMNVANWNLGKVKLETIFAGQRLVSEVGAVLGFVQGLQ